MKETIKTFFGSFTTAVAILIAAILSMSGIVVIYMVHQTAGLVIELIAFASFGVAFYFGVTENEV